MKITREERKKLRTMKQRSGVIVEMEGSNGHKHLVDLAARSCTCPAWRFQKKPIQDRTCKHVEAAVREHEQTYAAKPDRLPLTDGY